MLECRFILTPRIESDEYKLRSSQLFYLYHRVSAKKMEAGQLRKLLKQSRGDRADVSGISILGISFIYNLEVALQMAVVSVMYQ